MVAVITQQLLGGAKRTSHGQAAPFDRKSCTWQPCRHRCLGWWGEVMSHRWSFCLTDQGWPALLVGPIIFLGWITNITITNILFFSWSLFFIIIFGPTGCLRQDSPFLYPKPRCWGQQSATLWNPFGCDLAAVNLFGTNDTEGAEMSKREDVGLEDSKDFGTWPNLIFWTCSVQTSTPKRRGSGLFAEVPTNAYIRCLKKKSCKKPHFWMVNNPYKKR